MAKKYCAAYPCPNLVGKGERFCPEHKPAKIEQKIADPFYVSARWKRLSKWYRAKEPLCEMCGAPGRLVDHIKEIKDGGALLDETNIQTLCSKCHATKTLDEQKRRKKPKIYDY